MRFFVFAAILLLLVAPAGISAAEKVGVIPITGTIDGGVDAFVVRCLKDAERQGMEAVILTIDTPGGRIDSAVHIKDTLLDARIPVIAFVDKNAISAGALIALACDSIYYSTGASLGAATAVDLEGNKASEKIISYFRAQMRATAEATGRRPDIAEAMVDEEIVVPGVSPKGSLLTLTYTEALELGYSNGTRESIPSVLQSIGRADARVERFSLNWAERLVRVFTHPLVSSLMLSLGFLGLLFEIKTPGWGVGGTLALIALSLFFGSHFLVRLAGIEDILIFLAGVTLLGIEVFFIPGFGFVGTGGIALIVISLYLSLVGNVPEPADASRAMLTLGWAVVVTVIAGFFLIRALPRSSLFHKISLGETEQANQGYTAAATDTGLVGREGKALTSLRPAGSASIGDRRVDVVTEGGFIDAGAEIVVTKVEGMRVVVREREVI